MKRMVNLLLVAILLASTYLDYWEYSVSFHRDPGQYPAVVRGLADAPAQYRIGVIDTVNFLSLHTHAPFRYLFTLIDLSAGLAAAFTLLGLLRRSATYRQSSAAWQWVGELAFLGLVEYYLHWLTWYQRPETLTSAALLAFSLALVDGSSWASGKARPAIAVSALLAIAVAQSLVRADVIFAFHLGVLAVCLLRGSDRGAALSPPMRMSLSTLCLLVTGCVQYLLMHRLFPHSTYGTTSVVQLRANLEGATGYPPFLLFMLPFFWALWRVLVRKDTVTNVEASTLAGSAIFAGMWFVLGVAQEVRIFLPFGLLLGPLTAGLLMRRAQELRPSATFYQARL